ncbi:MAG: hydroxymethylglutaryl-CoA lyase [Planctomycetota bacterium]
MTERVRITDVSPRDGLQNEPLVEGQPIATDRKAALVRASAEAGVDEIEVTSFVSRRWVPQLGDAAELCRLLAREPLEGIELSALVPNERGMRGLLEANERAGRLLISKASVFTAASETFSRKNTNATIDETFERFKPVMELARGLGLRVRGYVSCAIACPFDGPIAPAAVADVSRRLHELGVDEVDLGDTIGRATPESMREMLSEVTRSVPVDRLVVHLHDTFGRAASCVRAALDHGVRAFDGSAGGLGGCPYASTATERAPGNISLQSLVDAVHDAGFTTGIRADKLSAANALATGMRSGT